MTEIEIQKMVIDQFGLEFNHGYSCISNAVVNGNKIDLQNQIPGSQFPQIYTIDLRIPRFKNPVTHAYPVWEGIVLNGGVTAEWGWFPDLTLDFLKSNARNITEYWLEKATLAFFSQTDQPEKIVPYLSNYDTARIRKHMEQIYSGETLIKAAENLRQAYMRLR